MGSIELHLCYGDQYVGQQTTSAWGRQRTAREPRHHPGSITIARLTCSSLIELSIASNVANSLSRPDDLQQEAPHRASAPAVRRRWQLELVRCPFDWMVLPIAG